MNNLITPVHAMCSLLLTALKFLIIFMHVHENMTTDAYPEHVSFNILGQRINRQYGYSIEGTPAYRCEKFNPWGPRHAVISAISMEGLLCVNILDERVSANADTFVNFLEIHLLPALQPFNGINSAQL